MNNIQLFQYEEKPVRTVTIDGEPWWIAKDVCAILKYANASDAIKTHCKGIANSYPLQTPGGLQEVRIISEPDLYRLIIKSTLPEAEKFEKWVFETVLPSIRKTGKYEIESDPKKLISLALVAANRILEEQKPLVEFAEAVRESKEGVLVREFVKNLNPTTGEKRFYEWLREQKIIMPGKTEPYQTYIDMGIFEMKPNPWTDNNGEKHVGFTTTVTGKGQIYLEKKWREFNRRSA